jgi:hypothetical protein
MEAEISGASSEVHGAATTSGTSIARLSIVPPMIMASLALGGGLIGIIV